MNWYEAVREADQTGKILQMWDEQTDNWIPAPMNNFDTTRQYRAVEVSYDKSLYRPYCEDDWKEFKGKEVFRFNGRTKYEIIGIVFYRLGWRNGAVVLSDGNNVDFQELFNNYKHFDGSPCGVLIKN